jgi:uncharacterized protein
MEKTTVYLPDDLKAAVKRAAKQRGVSEGEVIRDLIRIGISGRKSRPRGALYSGRRATRRFWRAVIVDTSALLAYFDVNEPDHRALADVIEGSEETLVVSPYVIAELDYLVATRVVVDAELAVLRELACGAWELAVFGVADLDQAASVIKKYRDQQIGAADASNVVLADRYQTRTIATLDLRQFSGLRRGGRFAVVP